MDIDHQSLERLYGFASHRRQAVIATASYDGLPQAALIDIAVSPELEFIFETTNATRKYPNLMRNPRVCLVVGWDDDQTLQLDGLADQPAGAQLDRLKALYLLTFPHKASHESWPGNGYFRVRPRWARFSNYSPPRKIEEFQFPAVPGDPAEPKNWWSRLYNPHPGRKQRN